LNALNSASLLAPVDLLERLLQDDLLPVGLGDLGLQLTDLGLELLLEGFIVCGDGFGHVFLYRRRVSEP
jgi:hypothetical protein